MHTLLIREMAKKSLPNISLKLSLASCTANYTSVTKNACSEAMRRKMKQKKMDSSYIFNPIDSNC